MRWKTVVKPHLHIALGMLLGLLAAFLTACTAAAVVPPCGPDTFSIYLTAEPLNGGAILKADLDGVLLEANPILTMQDILAFEQQKGELSLVPAAMQRLSQLIVPTDGRAFVICSNTRRLAVGAFWTALSSASYNGLTILQPLGEELHSVHFSNAYPSGAVGIEDLKVLKALEQAGKLR
jgi:hypothetical protein